MRIIKLPLSTSHVLAGPLISLNPRELLVRYDMAVDGSTDWAEIRFSGVIRFRYCDFSVCDEDDIMGHDYFVEETDAPALHALRARRSALLRANRFEHEKDTREPLKLYHLYFDDVAALQVIARSFETSVALPEKPTDAK